MKLPGDDPRRMPGAQGEFGAGEQEPVVGSDPRRVGPVVIVAGFAILAVILFLVLNGRRASQTQSLVTPAATQTAATAPPPPLDIPATPVPTAPAVIATPVPAPAKPVTPDDTTQRLHAPSVVVDLQSDGGAGMPISSITKSPAPPQASAGAHPSDEASEPSKTAATTSNGAIGPAGAAASGSALLSGASGDATPGGLTGSFGLGGADVTPHAAMATQMIHLETTVAQGTTIPAVMETAINSDLPGLTRAVVSRDVRGFDGKTVLIPRGSRVIGEYRSALALGQSRVFVIWSRVIRPDGVTVQIGSPGGDALGRGGLDGDVDNHFFGRFGGSILLSVLNAGVTAIAGTPSTQISIGSPAAAAGAAASASVPTSSDILPTISVQQGAAVNIFVARDLDFSNVKPVQ